MARGEVCLRLPDGQQMPARTDLTGHGNVHAGEEFVARELWAFGRGGLMHGGRKMRVRVLAVDKSIPNYHRLEVVVLADMTPQRTTQEDLF